MEGRIFALDQQTLISIAIMLFNACVLAGVLSFLLYKPVRRFMQKRADGIRAQLSRAQEQQDTAQRMNALYEEKLEEIEGERERILEAAHKLAAEKRAQILAEAEKEAAALKERAAAELRARRARFEEENRRQVIDTAAAMAGKFVAGAMDRQAQDRLFAETLAALEGAL